MRNLTANIAFLFPELPFLDRIDAAKAAGFDKVECHFPYEFPIEVLKERLDRAGVQLTGLNTQPGDKAKAEWGFAGVRGREDQFRRDFDQALKYATALGASVIHVMAGTVAPADKEAALQTYVANLREAGRQASAAGVVLLLEPLNHRDSPGYLVTRSDEIADIVAEIGEPNVKLLFDVYPCRSWKGTSSSGSRGTAASRATCRWPAYRTGRSLTTITRSTTAPCSRLSTASTTAASSASSTSRGATPCRAWPG